MMQLRRSAALGLGLAGAASASAPACPSDLDPYLAEASPFGWPVAPAEWQFSRPECWAERYPMCAGDRQSPMNLDFSLTNAECRPMVKGSDGALAQKGHYKPLDQPVVSVSKYLRAVSVADDLGSLSFQNNAEYEATSMYLAAPSLHAIDGEHAAAELMIVHKPKGEADALGSAVVVSVLFEAGNDESALFSQLGFEADGGREVHKDRSEWKAAGKVDVLAAAQAALAGKSYSYDGSVPVPPCTENVRWVVLSSKQSALAPQLDALKEQLIKHAGGVTQRPLARRDPNEICREVKENCVAAPVTPAPDCTHAAGRTAACWEETCGLSPINVNASKKAVRTVSKEKATDLMRYEPSSHVVVAPSPYSLDAKGNFGRLVVRGRSFEATKVSVKAISSHTFDGRHYAGELLVEHTLYGDELGAVDHGADGHGDGHHRRLESHGSAHGSAAGLHKVIVSVPLKLGRESPLLRALGLGKESHREAIRDGNAYPVDMPVDLGTELEASISKEWFWYSGGLTTPGSCPAWGIKWMLFSEPLEVSLAQLNFLTLKVSGVDATPLPVHRNLAFQVHRDFVPAQGVVVSGSCTNRDQLHNDPACWPITVAGCAASAQSPIDIQSFGAGEAVGKESYLHKTSWKPVSGLRMLNNGHSLHFESNQLGYTTVIGANGFPKYYQVTGVYLKMPSEHTINGKHFPAELQIIQKNQKTVLEFDDDDVIISSVLFELGEESKLLGQMLGSKIPAAGHHATVEQPVDLQWALGPVLDAGYYRYDGSFTTPSCAEVVQWVVFEKTMTISMEQWKAFKAAFPNPGNNRPLQALNGRAVSRNTMIETVAIDYDFFLNREMGRDKRETNPALIAFPIIATLLLCSVSAFSIFQREDKARRGESAGGLEATTVGRSYGQL